MLYTYRSCIIINQANKIVKQMKFKLTALTSYHVILLLPATEQLQCLACLGYLVYDSVLLQLTLMRWPPDERAYASILFYFRLP